MPKKIGWLWVIVLSISCTVCTKQASLRWRTKLRCLLGITFTSLCELLDLVCAVAGFWRIINENVLEIIWLALCPVTHHLNTVLLSWESVSCIDYTTSHNCIVAFLFILLFILTLNAGNQMLIPHLLLHNVLSAVIGQSCHCPVLHFLCPLSSSHKEFKNKNKKMHRNGCLTQNQKT